MLQPTGATTQAACWINSPAAETERHRELLYENPLLFFVIPKTGSVKPSQLFCSRDRAIFLSVVSQHKEDFMSSPGSSCTKIQKLKLGTVGFIQ